MQLVGGKSNNPLLTDVLVLGLEEAPRGAPWGVWLRGPATCVGARMGGGGESASQPLGRVCFSVYCNWDLDSQCAR